MSYLFVSCDVTVLSYLIEDVGCKVWNSFNWIFDRCLINIKSAVIKTTHLFGNNYNWETRVFKMAI